MKHCWKCVHQHSCDRIGDEKLHGMVNDLTWRIVEMFSGEGYKIHDTLWDVVLRVMAEHCRDYKERKDERPVLYTYKMYVLSTDHLPAPKGEGSP